ncbi:hypothetical protein EX075_13895 [Salmonella enterica]|nr:hypothetical protein [Salmonella enterica]EGK9673210.1 hypothetical protein [Salmonella enterica]
MKKVSLILGMAMWGWVATASAANNGDGVDAFADAYQKQHPAQADDSESVKKDPASGFWTCNGIKLHMGVDLRSWQELNTGDMYVLTESGAIDDKDKDEKVKGTDYVYKWTKNPAVLKFFIVDKTGKNLYLRDDLHYFKTNKCKRDK